MDSALCKIRGNSAKQVPAKLTIEISTQKNPDDVVITLSLRTPLTKARKGGFKDAELDYIVYALLKETLAKSKIDPALVEDVCLGNVCGPCQSKKCLSDINHLTSI